MLILNKSAFEQDENRMYLNIDTLAPLLEEFLNKKYNKSLKIKPYDYSMEGDSINVRMSVTNDAVGLDRNLNAIISFISPTLTRICLATFDSSKLLCKMEARDNNIDFITILNK